METYGKILLFAMPAFLLLVLLEKAYGRWRGMDSLPNMDMIASLSSGITNVTKDVLGLALVIISYPWLLRHFALLHLQEGWPVYLVAFLSLDFLGYTVHRIQHRVNFFWNGHIIHHSSEEYNLACALRQSISGIARIFAIFLLPAALLGVPAQVIDIVAPLHLFAQFWYHTRHIGKMGWLEKIIVTPSHHRVHHAINPEYIDKNYGNIFIFWDKLFGSFQPELPDVPPVYGITRPVQTWNPIKINFMHLGLLLRDSWHARNWKDKFRVWWMPTGWRPADVAQRYPVYKIEDVYHFQKYRPRESGPLSAWSGFQLTVTLLLIAYLFGNIATINQLDPRFIYFYGGFIFLTVYAYTELMDRHPAAIIYEALKNLTGLLILWQSGDWFGASRLSPVIKYLLAGYFIGATLITAWFAYRIYLDNRQQGQSPAALG